MTRETKDSGNDWATAAVLIVLILALLASCHLPKFLEPQDCECATEEKDA